MLNIAGCRIIALLSEHNNSLVYRAYRLADEQAVILKMIKDPYPPPERLAAFKQEYEILRRLNIEGVVKAYHLETGEQQRLIMLLEDFGGESLANLKIAGKLSLEEFLTLGISLTKTLGKIHAKNIIHQDINLSNLVFNSATKQLKFIDFSIASLASKNILNLEENHLWPGTVAYMSPEQTGRLNRVTDFRTDFYSLGVTFYELLTGQLPFTGEDPLELIHAHIAKEPIPPSEINPAIPPVISQIIMKLLAKDPEHRYQSAWGIQSDLATCLMQLQTEGKIKAITLGANDISQQFKLSQKIYGRTAEMRFLTAELERLLAQPPRMLSLPKIPKSMILVTGDAGMGKSAFVKEFFQPLIQKRGYFMVGKAQPDVPYAAFTAALKIFIQQLLSESKLQLNQWRDKIKQALGSHLSIIMPLIPELSLIIEPTEPDHPIDAVLDQDMVQQTFLQLFRVFCTGEYPVGIFLDDLQWADAATLKLLERIVTDFETYYLFVIVAYRHPEVNRADLLAIAFKKIRQAGVIFQKIELNPLSVEDITHLIADTFSQDFSRAKLLAEIVAEKTLGNPYFVKKFLTSLYQQNLISFDRNAMTWQWDLSAIAECEITENVVNVLVNKIATLPQATQKLLPVAACIGITFKLSTLAAITESEPAQVLANLMPAVQEKLLLLLPNSSPLNPRNETESLGDSLFKFQHKKLQIMTEFMSDFHLRNLTKLQMARWLLQQNKAQESSIFELVDYYNQGIPGIRENQEKFALAELNFNAAQVAKKANQYGTALSYLQIARKLLAESKDDAQQSLLRNIYADLMEIYYLQNKFTQAENLALQVLREAKNAIDLLIFYEIKIKINLARNQLKLAWETGLYILEKVHISLVKFTQELPAIEKFKTLPKSSNILQQNALKILRLLYIPVLVIFPEKLSYLAQTMLNLCQQYGNCPESAFAYVLYGIILCEEKQEFELGYQFGKLGLSCLNRDKDSQNYFLALKLFNAKILPYQKTARLAIKSWLKIFKLAPDNYLTVIKAKLIYDSWLFFIGKLKIKSFHNKSDLSKYNPTQLNEYLKKYLMDIWPNLTLIFLNKPENYLGNQELINFWLNVEQLPEAEKTYFHRLGLFHFHLSQSILAYWFKNYFAALQHGELAENYQRFADSTLAIANHKFYFSLALLAILSKIDEQKIDAKEKKRFCQKVQQNQEKLRILAKVAPMNFLHKYQLVEAEKARYFKDYWQAGLFYEQAIAEAEKNQYTQEAGLARELAAEFYFSQNLQTIGKTYLSQAHETYIACQIWGKVKDLESRYPESEHIKFFAQSPSSQNLPQIGSSQTGNIAHSLDLNSILKASQTLASEIMLETLLEKMMHLVLENAGAQKGYLLIPKQDQWIIQASGMIAANRKESIQVQQSIPIDMEISLEHDLTENFGFSRASVNYVIHTKENLVLHDAAQEANFIHDPYILQQQPKSILCVPLINQGKLAGILYLENNLATGAFTAERLEVLKLLSSQAAIALENAYLYAQLEDYSRSLEQKVKQRTEELAQATRQAQAASEAKSLFLANMSHELRTPLNAIIGFAQVMNRSDNLPPEHRENLHIIMRSGEHLLNLINQVLDLSKIEAGRITLNRKKFDLYLLLDELEDMFQLKAEEKMLQLNFSRCPKVPQYICTDEVKLRQVLINLLNNAIKFTNYGGVSLRVTVVDNLSLPDAYTSDISQQLLFEVEDTGPGIAADEINTLFQAFTQTKTGQAAQEGTGLGLALSASFVKLMGGEIRVTSEVGHGTIFQFNIQVELVPPEQVEPQQSERQVFCLEPNQPRYRILVVDDKLDNRQLLVKLLSPLGFELETASNGAEAIQLWESFSPDLIWMDLRMPVMNGYQATQKIKASPKGKRTVIIALTASILEEERSQIFAVGCDDLVYKPFRPQTIFEKMAEHLGLRYIYEATAPVSAISQGAVRKTTLTKEALSAMPVDWVVKLHQGSLEADADLVGELIEEIPESQRLLAQAIQGLVSKFQFEKIIELTELIINEERSS